LEWQVDVLSVEAFRAIPTLEICLSAGSSSSAGQPGRLDTVARLSL
jgi:hypothetical protein